MPKHIQAKESTDFTSIVDRSYLMRLCEEIYSSLREQRETDVFFFMFRYFQTLLQQDRLKEATLFLDTFEHHPFKGYADQMASYIGYLKAFLRKAQGKTNRAAFWFRQTLKRYEQLEMLGIKNVRVYCYKELGSLKFYQELYADAIENYQSAINNLSLDQDSEYLLAILMYNLALCQYYLNHYKQTLDYLNKAIPLAKDTSNSYLLLDALILKSVLLTEHFKLYRESNEHLEQAYEIADRNGHATSINKIWNNWGHNFFHLKRDVLAEQALRHSIKLSQEHDDLEVRLFSELLLAEIWLGQGLKQQSKQLLEGVRKKAINRPEYSAELLDCLELLKRLEGDAKKREIYVEEAYKLACAHKKYATLAKKVPLNCRN